MIIFTSAPVAAKAAAPAAAKPAIPAKPVAPSSKAAAPASTAGKIVYKSSSELENDNEIK